MEYKITTLEQLEKEKKKLKMTMTVTRDAFAKSLGTNRKELKRFVLTKVAIPAGVIGLGAVAVKQISGTKKSKKKSRKSTGSALFSSLFPLALKLLQAYFLKRQNEKIEEKIPEPAVNTNPAATTLKAVS